MRAEQFAATTTCTIKEVANRLQVSPNPIHGAAENGRIEGRRIRTPTEHARHLAIHRRASSALLTGDEDGRRHSRRLEANQVVLATLMAAFRRCSLRSRKAPAVRKRTRKKTGASDRKDGRCRIMWLTKVLACCTLRHLERA
jgi:hypothetical protein